jgi:hypothetical protein
MSVSGVSEVVSRASSHAQAVQSAPMADGSGGPPHAVLSSDLLLRDDVLSPMLVEAGVRGDLPRAAAVSQRWAEVASKMWPLVVKEWNVTLQDDLRFERAAEHARGYLMIHDKSATTINIDGDFVLFNREHNSNEEFIILPSTPPSAVNENNVVYAQWMETSRHPIVETDRSRVSRVRKRRPFAIIWTGRAFTLTWTGEAADEHVIVNVNNHFVFGGVEAFPFNAVPPPPAGQNGEPDIGFMEEVD